MDPENGVCCGKSRRAGIGRDLETQTLFGSTVLTESQKKVSEMQRNGYRSVDFPN